MTLYDVYKFLMEAVGIIHSLLYFQKHSFKYLCKFTVTFYLVPRRPFENAFRRPLTSLRIFSTIPGQFSAVSAIARDFMRSATNFFQTKLLNRIIEVMDNSITNYLPILFAFLASIRRFLPRV